MISLLSSKQPPLVFALSALIQVYLKQSEAALNTFRDVKDQSPPDIVVGVLSQKAFRDQGLTELSGLQAYQYSKGIQYNEIYNHYN